MFRDQSSHAVSMQNLKRCILCGPSPIATGPGPVIGSSENRSQLTGSAPLAKRQALFNILNFLPAMKSGTTCTDKESRKLAKQRHLPCSQNTPEETFSKPFKMLHYNSGKKKQSTTPRHVHVLTNPTSCSAGPTSKTQNSKYNSREWPWLLHRCGIVTDTFP